MNYSKPEHLKELQGTARKDREISIDLEESPEIPSDLKPPTYLSAVAKKKWRELVKDLVESGLLKNVDLGSLEMCCIAYGDAMECQREIKKQGGLANYVAGRSAQEIPLMSQKKAAMESYKKYIAEFGLSPASRAKMGIRPKKKESAMSGFKKRKQMLANT